MNIAKETIFCVAFHSKGRFTELILTKDDVSSFTYHTSSKILVFLEYLVSSPFHPPWCFFLSLGQGAGHLRWSLSSVSSWCWRASDPGNPRHLRQKTKMTWPWKIFFGKTTWLVGGFNMFEPSWKIWVGQWEGSHPIYSGKYKMCQTTNQMNILTIGDVWENAMANMILNEELREMEVADSIGIPFLAHG